MRKRDYRGFWKFIPQLATLATIGFLFTGSTLLSESNDQAFNWYRVLDAYDAYVDYPSVSNGKTLLAALPMDRPSDTIGDGERVLKHIYSADNYPILHEEAISGDRTAMEIHFRLLNVGDGIYNESVEATLGWLVRDQPELFLELLASHKNTKHVRTYGYPVAFVGLGHNTHPRSAIYVLEKRIEALEAVKDPRYKEIKETCVKQIREAIKQLPEIGSLNVWIGAEKK